jgi:hypothetical protein
MDWEFQGWVMRMNYAIAHFLNGGNDSSIAPVEFYDKVKSILNGIV